MAEFVAASFKLRHVGFKDCISRHIPKDTGVLTATLRPRHYFRCANVFDEIRFVPALSDPHRLCEIVRLVVVAIRQIKIEMVDESQIAEHLQHEREAGDCEQACGLCGAAVEMTMGDVDRAREKASFDPG